MLYEYSQPAFIMRLLDIYQGKHHYVQLQQVTPKLLSKGLVLIYSSVPEGYESSCCFKSLPNTCVFLILAIV